MPVLRYTEFCHLLADEPGELHEMAERLGMPRRSFQDHPWRWHYDLPGHLRADAVRFGAREIELGAVGRLLRERRRALDDVTGVTTGPGAHRRGRAGA